jgi:cytidyltransferase-like protein
MFEYIFTIGCFDKLHKGHIKLLEGMQKQTEKIIVGLHDNNSIEKLKNISDIDSYDNRKKNLEKYAYDVFKIDDIDPTQAIRDYILKNLTEIDYDEIKNTNISENTDLGNFNYNNFEIFSTDFNYLIPHCDKNRDNSFWLYDEKNKCINIWDTLDVNICKNHELIDNSNIKIQKYRCLCESKCNKLPIGIRSKHVYKDDNYIIYNERDNGGQLFKSNGNGRMISKTNKTDYESTIFDIHNNSTKNGGSEDYRYIIFNEDLYVIMNGLPKNSKQRQMYLYNIKKNEICQLYIKNYDVMNIYQKNWTPYVYKNELYFIYSFCELCVIKLKNGTTGECELVYGNPSLFTNKTIFGGTNLCYWKNDLFIGFAHIRNPWYGVPIIFDAKNYKYITTTTPIKIKTPFEINLNKHRLVQYPYYFKKCQDKYELSVCHQDFYSIKYEISINKIDSLFTNLLSENLLEPITIGPSQTNSKVIKSDYTGNLFFIHKYKDTFKYHCKNNNITVSRTDVNSGWGQNLIGYKKNWCFMRGVDNIYNKNFLGIDYIKSIIPIRDNNVVLMNYLLHKVVDIIDENNIPYYLDCGTLLGCIRENGLMEKDTDVDITIHLSYWDKLKSIDFNKYGLERTRTRSCKKKGYIISVKTEYSDLYCDIYANPAFPQLDVKEMNNKNYCIPINSDLYLTQLYGNWKIPSKKHAAWPKLFYSDKLIKSEYSKYWDLDFEIKLDPIPSIKKKNLNKTFWETYYKLNNHDINKSSSFAEFVYLHHSKHCKHILDLGCGNCRDSIFFSQKGIEVEAVDYNGHIEKKYDNLTFIKEEVKTFLSNNNKIYSLIYMRWFLHAMPYENAEKIFELATNNLSNDGKICIEVRSLNDDNLKTKSVYDKDDLSYKTTHKRWLYTIDKLDKLFIKYNMKSIYMEEGYFSPNKNTETDNPLLIRCVIIKK